MALSLFEEKRATITVNTILAASVPIATGINSVLPVDQRVDNIVVTTDDTADVLVELHLQDTFATDSLLNSYIIPALSGTDGVHPAVDLLATLNLAQNGIVIPIGCTCTFAIPSAITAGKQVGFIALGAIL